AGTLDRPVGPVDLRAEPGTAVHGAHCALATLAEFLAQLDDASPAVAVDGPAHVAAARRAAGEVRSSAIARVLSSPELFRRCWASSRPATSPAAASRSTASSANAKRGAQKGAKGAGVRPRTSAAFWHPSLNAQNAPTPSWRPTRSRASHERAVRN